MKTAVFGTLILLGIAACQPHERLIVNFAHLQHLTEPITLDGERVSIVHIYADAPAYRWTDASDEGIACVDDAARAAVAYLRAYELRRDTLLLNEARALLRFVMFMQADDGEFYNFLLPDHSINRTGKTSFKSFGWWAGRGVWAMALGARVMKDDDPPFALALKERVIRSLPHVDSLFRYYGRTQFAGSFRTPEWLVYNSGSDATTELTLGLLEFYRMTGDERVGMQIRKLSEGMMMMQDGDGRTFPYGAHRSWKSLWHSWGNGQTQALAAAGMMLHDSAMIRSAEREARGFYSRLLIGGMAKEWDFSNPGSRTDFEQIAYGIRPMAVGLLRLYDATGDKDYLKMAGIAASWFFGNNVLATAMYDSTSGRCFDGIKDAETLNRNSGAESTIEALYTLVEMEHYPGARRYLFFRKIASTDSGPVLSAIFGNTAGERLTFSLDSSTGELHVQ